MVTFFENRSIPLAINHCIAAYPHEDNECELNQIDFLRQRYPNHTIGYSSHEHKDWTTSIQIAYAKGARTFERHIDIEMDGLPVAKYSSLPNQIDTWFKAFYKGLVFCGASGHERKAILQKETDYLDTYIRGVYAAKNLPKDHQLEVDDVYLAIPLPEKSDFNEGPLMLPENSGHKLTRAVKRDAPINIDILDTPYSDNPALRAAIASRGL